MNNFILVFALSIFVTSSIQAELDCYYATCDRSIVYAMSKQRRSLSRRLSDTIGAIRSTKISTKDQTLILTYEIKAYMRLKERLKIEYLLLTKASLLSKKAAHSNGLVKRTDLIK